jgi:nicotinamidase-related amidase
VAAILNAARQAERPVIHTAFAATHLGYDRPAPGAFMPNRYPGYSSPAHRAEPRFVEDLQPAENEIVLLKPSYGAFYDTPLDTILHNLGCDTLVITGTLTNLCCGMTARQAYERGYKVLFAADATATTLPELQEAELQTLRYGFARIMNAQEIVCMFAERYA